MTRVFRIDGQDFAFTVHDQVGRTEVEAAAASVTAELMTLGWMESQSYYWDDRAISLAPAEGGPVVAFICWRPVKHAREAYISLGGVAPHFRRRGLYGWLFRQLVEILRTDHESLTRISSGHAIANEASQAMHLARGSRPATIGYTFDLEPRP